MTATFDAVFAFFVLSMLVIAVLAVRWSLRRDRAAREGGAGEDPGGPSRAPQGP